MENQKEYTEHIKQKAEAITDKFRKDIQSLADDVRRDLVIPLCKEKDLSFTSTGRNFYFITRNGYRFNSSESYLAVKLGVIDVFDVLSIQTYGEDRFLGDEILCVLADWFD